MIEFWSKVLLLAVLFDILFGEPPAFIHPVVWMGKLIDCLRALRLPATGECTGCSWLFFVQE